MPALLLETKFHLPSTHGRLVPRPRLSDQIARAAEATLTLVSAPAGFGKTTVMTELATRLDGARVAWLSLDPSDNGTGRVTATPGRSDVPFIVDDAAVVEFYAR